MPLEEGRCQVCKMGAMKPVPETKIRLPTPTSEIVFGGNTPQYAACITLPLEYCDTCGFVRFKRKK